MHIHTYTHSLTHTLLNMHIRTKHTHMHTTHTTYVYTYTQTYTHVTTSSKHTQNTYSTHTIKHSVVIFCNLMLLMEEFYGTWYLRGSFSLINVGSGCSLPA